jgi:uncharacterized protein
VHKDMGRLYELQQIDSAIFELEADLKALDDGSGLRAELAAAQQELAQRKARHAEDAAAQVKREAELEKTELKRKRLMDKAYAGTISNPKELETLEKEIESLSRQKDRIETDLLALFDQVDDEKRLFDEEEALVASLETRLQETLATYASERERIGRRISELEQERAALKPTIDAEVLRKYDYLRERCGKLAVVAVEKGACSGCRVMLPVVQAARLARSPELQQCESCLRLLWVPIDEEDE